MQTFSCAVQTVNIEDHIVAQFEAGTFENPDDTSKCRMTVWHQGGEATITTFDRNGLVINTVMIPPPSQQQSQQEGVAAQASTGAKDPSDPNADKKGKQK